MPKGIPLTEEEQVKRRHEIFHQVVNVFLKKGFPETSMREIAETAGLGKSTLYDYFQTKDEILVWFGLEYRLTVVLDIRVMDLANGRVLWKEAGITETAPFYAGPDPQYTEANRRAAFEEAARRLAIRLAQTIRVVV